MTYEERIKYLVGNYLSIYQLAVIFAFRVEYLNENIKSKTPYNVGEGLVIDADNKAEKAFNDFSVCGSKELIDHFSNVGLSTKDNKLLNEILSQKDYFTNLLFVKNSQELAKEDVFVYQKLIDELNDGIEKIKKFNISMIKTIDKLAMECRYWYGFYKRIFNN